MQKITELYVLLEDKPGTIYELSRVLKKNKVNIQAIGLFVDTARLFVTDHKACMKVLQEHGYAVERREVLSIMMPNTPGALMEITKKMSNAGINIKSMYGTMEKGQKSGYIIMEVDKMDLTLELFENDRF
jgi:hypothetical protein